MIRERIVSKKYGMVNLVLEIKDAEVNTEVIQVHIHQGNTVTTTTNNRRVKYHGGGA